MSNDNISFPGIAFTNELENFKTSGITTDNKFD